MRRNAKSITTSPEIIRHIDSLTEANFQLLCKLMPWLDGHEKVQRKFRHVMVQRITWLEAAISLLLVGQEAQTQSNPPFYFADKLGKSAKAAQEFITKQSEAEGLKIVRYIYGEDKVPEPRRDRRRRWSGWEI